MKAMSIERRLQRLESELALEPGIYKFVDQNGEERTGTLDQMIECHGNFQGTIKGRNLKEGYRLMDYITELWGGTVIT